MTDTALRSADIVAGLPWALIGVMLLVLFTLWLTAAQGQSACVVIALGRTGRLGRSIPTWHDS